jgi:hypothetical protein
LERFDEKSVDKISSKIDKEIKVSPLMPIRVKDPCSSIDTSLGDLYVMTLARKRLPLKFLDVRVRA